MTLVRRSTAPTGGRCADDTLVPLERWSHRCRDRNRLTKLLGIEAAAAPHPPRFARGWHCLGPLTHVQDGKSQQINVLARNWWCSSPRPTACCTFYVHCSFPRFFKKVFEDRGASQYMPSTPREDISVGTSYDDPNSTLVRIVVLRAVLHDRQAGHCRRDDHHRDQLINWHYPIINNSFMLMYSASVEKFAGASNEENGATCSPCCWTANGTLGWPRLTTSPFWDDSMRG